MKKYLKFIGSIIITLLLTFSNLTNVDAASASISVSSSTSKIVVGNTFTVTIKISSGSALGSWEWVLNYDTSKFKLTSGDSYVADYASSGSVKSKSYTYKFKAVGTGTGTIGVKSYGAYEWSEAKLSLSAGSKSIKVITQADLQASYSKDNNLSSLTVDGYTLSPAFSKDVTEYTIEAGANTQTINIGAKKSDSKASVSGTGSFEVTEGENKFKIVVTAENGSTKTYNVTVNVTDPNPISVKDINDNELIVVKRDKNLTPPENFEKKEITINEQVVPAFYNEINDFTLIGLKDNEGEIKLYIYDENNNTYTLYSETALDQIKIFPLSIDKTFNEKYNKTEITINEVVFPALKLNKSEFAIIHAKDLSTGKENYYIYDTKENTIIRYNNDEAQIFEKQNEKYFKIIILLCVETIIMFIILICVLIAKINKNKRRKRKILEANRLEILKKQSHEQINDIIVNEEKEEIVLNNTDDEKEKISSEEVVKETIETKKEYKDRIKRERKEASRLKKEEKKNAKNDTIIKEEDYEEERTMDLKEEIKEAIEEQKKRKNEEKINANQEDTQTISKRKTRRKSIDEQLDEM